MVDFLALNPATFTPNPEKVHNLVAPHPTTFTPQQRLILEHFLETKGIALTRERIIAVLYGNDWDGGPDDAAKAVRNHILRLRERLDAHGIKVLTIGIGQGAEGWMVDPDHILKLFELIQALPAMAVEAARGKLPAHPS